MTGSLPIMVYEIIPLYTLGRIIIPHITQPIKVFFIAQLEVGVMGALEMAMGLNGKSLVNDSR